MAYLDAENLCSINQTIAAVASTIVCSSPIDLGATAVDQLGNVLMNDPARSRRVEMFAEVTEAVLSASSATVECDIIQSANSDLSSPDVLASTPAIAKASLVIGYNFKIELPVGSVTKRYLGLQYVIGTATTTAGKVTGGFVLDRQTAPRSLS